MFALRDLELHYEDQGVTTLTLRLSLQEQDAVVATTMKTTESERSGLDMKEYRPCPGLFDHTTVLLVLHVSQCGKSALHEMDRTPGEPLRHSGGRSRNPVPTAQLP